MSSMLSLIIPCYNEEGSIGHLYTALADLGHTMESAYGVGLEILLIDDGSADNTLPLLKDLAEKDPCIRYISFSRNYGKEAALYAGLTHSRGDYVALMDGDLQHPPALLPAMYESLAKEGYDCACARRMSHSGEPPLRALFSRLFFRMMNRLSQTTLLEGATDFAMMTRQMADALLATPERNRFSKGLYAWAGFSTQWIPYENVLRTAGKSKWTFKSLLLYSLEGILSFAKAPLLFAIWLGALLCLLGLCLLGLSLVRAIFYGDGLLGNLTLLGGLGAVGGLQLFCLGIIAQYLAKIYLEAKGRPLYIIKESNCEKG